LVAQEFNEQMDHSPTGANELILLNHRPPLAGWDVDRVREEILPFIDPDVPYPEWTAVGMALHHQGQGAPEWCAAWDEWSAAGSKYVEGDCEGKWPSFSQKRAQGRGPLTLRHLIEKTQESRKKSAIDALLRRINSATSANDLEQNIAKAIARESSLSDTDREQLVREITKKSQSFNLRVPIATIRRWVQKEMPRNFPDLARDGTPLATIENLEVLMARMGATVRYNVISKRIELLIPNRGFTQDNQYGASLAYVFSEASRCGMPYGLLDVHLLALADKNQYNPVMQWVESKPWDGVPRVDALIDTLVSPMPGDRKKVFVLKWLKQCVAGAFLPNGISPQGVLVLQGRQNIGKTRWVQSLAPIDLDLIHIGHTLDVKNKDSVITATGFWIVELGELDATFTRSDISSLKAFATQNCDRVRRPYAKAESHHPRRTSLFASVNDVLFLNDPTGNRRFWVIPVENVIHDHRIDMQQLWAEVLTLWNADPQFHLTPDEEKWLNESNQNFTATDPIEERISRAFNWKTVAEWEWKTATEILVSLGLSNPNKGQAITAGRVVRSLNGDRYRKSDGSRLLAVPKPSPALAFSSEGGSST
jgi:putative DNA primase/helicase